MSKELFDMSDEELEAAFLAAKADVGSEPTQYEEEHEDLEQPVDNEDSDDDADMDASEDEAEDDGSDVDDETPDGEDADAEEEPETEEEPKQAEVQPIQKHKFKANGREYEFTEDEVREQFPKIFGQAMDYTKRMQALKPWRKTIDAIEGAQLSHDDVNLMIDVLKGDKECEYAAVFEENRRRCPRTRCGAKQICAEGLWSG